MTRDDAASEALRRNLADGVGSREIGAYWVEAQTSAGEWEVVLMRRERRPLWRRAARLLLDMALEPDAHQDAGLPAPPAHVWRRHRVTRCGGPRRAQPTAAGDRE